MAPTAIAQAQTVINVNSGASLSAAINTIDTVPSASGYVINVQNNITYSNTLNALNTTSNVTINGNGHTLDGSGVQRGLFVYSGNVAINNLTITHTVAVGGGGALGGGGGMGAGGALFVAAGGNVTVSNVSLLTNTAAGGAGGLGGYGGGGGLGGVGSNGGCCGGTGGGGIGVGANGGSPNSNGLPGIVIGAAGGGASSGGASGGINGGGGGGGNGTTTTGGGGGIGGLPGTGSGGGNGGWGGGGGSSAFLCPPGCPAGSGATGGNGGFGGGGGSALAGVAGAGGFGGGGGGSQDGGVGGNGGFGGGVGGDRNGSPGSSFGGGGGAGMGGAIFVEQGGGLTISGAFTVSGNAVTAGSGNAGGGGGSAFGNGLFLHGSGTVTFQPGSGQTQTVADVIADEVGVVTHGYVPPSGTFAGTEAWNLVKTGAGTLLLSGADLYSGTTAVNGGTLLVTNDITASSGVTVNSGGTLGGTGMVPAVTVANGGTLMPGLPNVAGILTVNGALVLASSATYAITINGLNAGLTRVGGSATLNGASVTIANGSSITPGHKYTIMQTLGVVSGTFSPTVTYGNFTGTLSYDPTDVFLTFTGGSLSALLPTAAVINEINVAATLDNVLNGGTAPPGLQNLFNLTPQQLGAALTQLSGEAATGAQQSAYQLMNEFLLLMTEPAIAGNGERGFAATPFAAEQTLPPDIAMAYASLLKAPPAPAPGRWSMWGSAYGGASRLSGDAAVIGSHDLSASAGGFAAGADRYVTPDTRVGFALAGGFTTWGLSDGLGGGHGDALQAGVYARTTHGPAYLAGALALAGHWMSTDRFALGDHLTGDFAAQSFGGRFEGGYRLLISDVGVIPYTAIQAQRFHMQGFTESDRTGGGLGLTYKAQDSSDTRAELGSRFDRFVPLENNALLAWRGRLAWAHDWVTNPTLLATFQALPGPSFVVNGAALKHDSALVTFGPEIAWRNGWSLLAKFDGAFANGAQTYGGTARLRYAW